MGDSPVSVAYQHVREDPVPPSELDPDVSPNVEAIVLKALAKDRDVRYQTADEMRRDIAQALAGRPVAAVAPLPQHTQVMNRTTVLPGTSTIPAVRDHRNGDQRGGRALGYALLALAVIAVFVIAALIARSFLAGGGPGKTTVPDVTGLSVSAAKTSLRAQHLTLGTQTKQSSKDVPPGTIIDQNPEDGSSVKKESPVDVTVSSGVDETAVPSLVGLSLDEATQALRDAHLKLGATTSVSSDEARNTVVKVSPKEGETVPAGSLVAVKYASGNNKVPDVVGDDLATARNKLEQAGFTVGPTHEQETADKPPDTVLSQSPGAGETQRLDTTITLTVAKAPATPTESPTPPTPSDTGSPTVTPPPGG